MRIGIVNYPLLFQRDAGMQLQIGATIRALNGLRAVDGVPLEVGLAGPPGSDLRQFDLIHVFSASGGNYRLVEAACALGVPVVLSPLISPDWDRACGEHARRADDGLGRQGAWSVQSSYAQTRRALQLASAVVALGEREKTAIEEGFLIDPERVRVFPNGVNGQLFEADGALFRQRTGISVPFVLMAGPISPYQDPLGMAQALSQLALPFVLLGDTRERDLEYLRQVQAVRGVTCLDGLRSDARLLASAYAAATLLVLPCQREACVRTVFDALATGTPVVLGTAQKIALPGSGFALHQVAWDDPVSQQLSMLRLIAEPPARDAVRDLVRPYSWDCAARQIASCYLQLARAGVALPA